MPEIKNALDEATLPCIACGAALRNVGMATDGNQPSGGLEFRAYGHYGSTSFDPMDGSSLIVNLCDPCVRAAVEAGRARELPPAGFSGADVGEAGDDEA